MPLDPDDPRPPYQQVANAVRAAILTRKFQPGEKLPSQAELSKHYGVARMTVQQSLRILRDEGLIVSRQGSGVFVRERTERPAGLRPHIEAAFSAEEVTVDFSGYTAETLHGALQEPIDKIRLGSLRPRSVNIRMLTADTSGSLALPSRAGDKPGDDALVRSRMAKTAERHTEAIAESVAELEHLGLVETAVTELRVHSAAPLFKMYLVNKSEVFFGYYPVAEHIVTIDKKKISIFDPMGKDAVLFHHAADGDPDSTGTRFVAESAKWFDSVWNTIAHELRNGH